MHSIDSHLRAFSPHAFAEVVERVRRLPGFLGEPTDADILRNALTWRRFFQPSSFYGHVLGPNASVVGRYRGFVDIYATDSWGISKNSVEAEDSDRRVLLAKQADQPVIAFFGGSTMQGVGSQIPDFSIPSLVEMILLSHYGVRATCVNHGVAGWCSAEQLLFLTHGLQYVPDVCVFYDGWNCCWNFFGGLLLNAFHIDDAAPIWRRGSSLRHYEYDLANADRFDARAVVRQAMKLMGSRVCGVLSQAIPSARWAHFWSRIAGTVFPLRNADPTRAVLTKPVPIEQRDKLLRDAVSEYLRIDALAAGLCHERGCKFLHFIQPLIHTTLRPLTAKEEQLRETSRTIANPDVFALFCREVATRSSDIIDLTGMFTDIEEDVFVDDGHLNRIGNYYAAKRIAHELVSRASVNKHRSEETTGARA